MGIYRYLRDRKRIQELNELGNDPEFVKRTYDSLAYHICKKRCKYFVEMQREVHEHGFSRAYDHIFDTYCKNCVVTQMDKGTSLQEATKAAKEEK